MDIDTIASLLGKRDTDPEVDAVLQRHGVARRPQLEVDSYDVDGPVVRSQDWVSNLSAGIEFGFWEESAFIMCLDSGDIDMGPMILTEIYFHGARPGVRPYPFPLPFGLVLSDSRSTVRAKMAPFEGTRRSYVRDTWECRAFRVTVNYADDGNRIDFVICMLRAEAPQLADSDDVILPSPADIVRLLGKSREDPDVQHAFRPLGLDRETSTTSEHQIIDVRKTYGIKLHFHKSSPAGRALFLRDVELVRPCGLASRGWPGVLPFDIRFDDSPEGVLGKVGQVPVRQIDDDFSG